MNYYTLYWLDGKKETVRGVDIEHALERAGYTRDEQKRLGFYCNGRNSDYEWRGGEWRMVQETKMRQIAI